LDDDQIGFIGSAVMTGWAVGCLFLSPMGDKYGRRGPFLACVFAEFLIWPFLLYVTDLNTYYVICFLMGVCIAGRWTIGYVLLTESMPKHFRIKVGLFYYFTDAAVIFWLTLYFFFVSHNWLYINLVQIAINVVGFFACLFYV